MVVGQVGVYFIHYVKCLISYKMRPNSNGAKIVSVLMDLDALCKYMHMYLHTICLGSFGTAIPFDLQVRYVKAAESLNNRMNSNPALQPAC